MSKAKSHAERARSCISNTTYTAPSHLYNLEDAENAWSCVFTPEKHDHAVSGLTSHSRIPFSLFFFFPLSCFHCNLVLIPLYGSFGKGSLFLPLLLSFGNPRDLMIVVGGYLGIWVIGLYLSNSFLLVLVFGSILLGSCYLHLDIWRFIGIITFLPLILWFIMSYLILSMLYTIMSE